AMNDQVLMRVGNSAANFSKDRESLQNRQSILAGIIVQSRTIDIFHDEVWQTRGRDGATMKLRDVCMTKAGQDPFFLLKTPDNVGRPQAELEKLDCHLTAQGCVFREINFAHTALADKRNDFVIAEFFAGFQFTAFLREALSRNFVSRLLNEIGRLFFKAQK